MVDNAMASRITTLRPALFAFLMSRCHCFDTADEVCQEACLKLLKIEIVPEDGEASFTKYAFAVANSCLNDYFRRRKRIDKESRGGSDETLQGIAESPKSYTKSLSFILEYISLLNEQEKHVIRSAICGLSNEQIAADYELSIDNVWKIRSRVCEKMRAFVQGNREMFVDLLNGDED